MVTGINLMYPPLSLSTHFLSPSYNIYSKTSENEERVFYRRHNEYLKEVFDVCVSPV